MEDEKPEAMAEAKAETKVAGKDPSYIAYAVREAPDGKSYFNRIGAAFPHKDGQGFTVDPVAWPAKGPMVLRTPQERIEKMSKEQSDPPSRADEERER